MRPTAVLAAVIVLAAAPAAHAAAAPAAQVRALAAQAAHDPRALAQLRQIDVVGGRPMRLATVLSGNGPALHARLGALARGAPASGPADARGEAADILAQRRYRGTPLPRPLHGPLATIGRGLRWLGHQIARPFRHLGLRSPGHGGAGSLIFWVALAVIVIGAAAVAATRIARRRGGVHVESYGSDRGGPVSEEDPTRLERFAEEAERAGDFAGALRLRFKAGLLRLARARVIPSRTSVTTREVRAALRSPEFDVLARTFDEVVYGHRDAARDDLEAARTGWPRVLAAVNAR